MPLFIDQYRNASIALFVIIMLGSAVSAEHLLVDNPDLDMQGIHVHGQSLVSSQLPKWRVIREENENVAMWFGGTTSGGWSVALAKGGVLEQTLTIPSLPEGRNPSKWYGLISVDVRGAAAGRGRAGFKIELVDPASGKPIVRSVGFTTKLAPIDPRVAWKAHASSENTGPREPSPASAALDGNPNTIWHSEWEDDQPVHPHYLKIDLGKPKRIKAVTYLPRQDRTTNGTISEYALYLSDNSDQWGKPAMMGTFDYTNNNKKEQEITLPSSRTARYIQLEVRSEINGDPFASAAEINVQTTDVAEHVDAKVERTWVYLPPEQLAELLERECIVRVSALTDRPVVIDAVRFDRFHAAPTRQLQNKSNGRSGPDYLDAGALGFSSLIEHQHTAMSVIHVRDNSPADVAGLKQGDCVVGVNRIPLGLNSSNPGWHWFHKGHEATLGRAIESAFAGDVPDSLRGVVELSILREGKPANLRLKLVQSKAFAASYPFNDPKADALAADMIAFVARTQRKDGSWDGDQIRTTFSALALLGSRDSKYAEQIKRAMDWTMERHSTPWGYGGLGYWKASYGSLLAAEYYLATHDDRVLPWLQQIIDWSASGDHNSAWGLPALGHGPSGLPYGNKSLVAPAVHLMVAEALAERCGLKANLTPVIWDTIEHAWSDPSDGGHGALGYNASYKDLDEFWSRTGLLALALSLRNDREDMVGPLTNVMRERFPWIRNSHAYGEPGGVLGLIALSVANPDAFSYVMRELRWTFALAWEPGHGLRFTMPHMGAPYMGEEALVNGAYGALLSVRHKGLHITGATDTGWLDVSKIPTKLTPVTIERDAEGKVILLNHLPGPEIRYTLDGSVPTADSNRYTKPFELIDGGLVKARAFDEAGKPGDTASASFGLSRENWRVFAASGSPVPQRAIEKAEHAIDGRESVVWQTNFGKDAAAFPHHLVIDLGERLPVTAVVMALRDKDTSPADMKIIVSDSPRDFKDPVYESVFDDFKRNRIAVLNDPAWGRYVRLDMTTAFTVMPRLLIAELDIISATVKFEPHADGAVALTAPKGFTVRTTTDGSTPTNASPLYDTPIRLEEGQPLKARCFAHGYEGPVTVWDREGE